MQSHEKTLEIYSLSNCLPPKWKMIQLITMPGECMSNCGSSLCDLMIPPLFLSLTDVVISPKKKKLWHLSITKSFKKDPIWKLFSAMLRCLRQNSLLFVVCCLLFVVCCLLFVVCCLLFVVCCLLFVICMMTDERHMILDLICTRLRNQKTRWSWCVDPSPW